MGETNMNQFKSSHKYFTIAIYAFLLFLACALSVKIIFSWSSVVAFVRKVLNVLSPYMVGIFIAYLLNPFVRFLDRWVLDQKCHLKKESLRKVIAIAVTYIISFGLIALAIRFIVPELISSVTDIVVNRLPDWYNMSLDWINDFTVKYPYFDANVVENLEKRLQEYLSVSYLTQLAQSILPSVWNTSMSVLGWIVDFLIALIVSIYLLSDKHILGTAFKRMLFAVVAKEKAEHFLETLAECNKIFGGFIWGKTVDSLIIGILCFITMSLLRMPYALLISIMIGVTNMIPYFGPFIGCVPGAFILLVTNPHMVIPYLIMILVIQQFDGLILGPKILGDFTGLRPVLILFAITVGGAIAKVPGMFLGVPCAAVLQFLGNRWIQSRLEARNVLKEADYKEKEHVTLGDIFYKGTAASGFKKDKRS